MSSSEDLALMRDIAPRVFLTIAILLIGLVCIFALLISFENWLALFCIMITTIGIVLMTSSLLLIGLDADTITWIMGSLNTVLIVLTVFMLSVGGITLVAAFWDKYISIATQLEVAALCYGISCLLWLALLNDYRDIKTNLQTFVESVGEIIKTKKPDGANPTS